MQFYLCFFGILSSLMYNHFQIAYTMQLKIEGKTYHAESNTKKAAKQGEIIGSKLDLLLLVNISACAAEAWNSIRATLL